MRTYDLVVRETAGQDLWKVNCAAIGRKLGVGRSVVNRYVSILRRSERLRGKSLEYWSPEAHALRFISSDRDNPPTHREVSDYTGVPGTRCYIALHVLRNLGYINFDDHKHRSITISPKGEEHLKKEKENE